MWSQNRLSTIGKLTTGSIRQSFSIRTYGCSSSACLIAGKLEGEVNIHHSLLEFNLLSNVGFRFVLSFLGVAVLQFAMV